MENLIFKIGDKKYERVIEKAGQCEGCAFSGVEAGGCGCRLPTESSTYFPACASKHKTYIFKELPNGQ